MPSSLPPPEAAKSSADQFLPVPLIDEHVAAGPRGNQGLGRRLRAPHREEEESGRRPDPRGQHGAGAALGQHRDRRSKRQQADPERAIYVVRVDGGVTAKYVAMDRDEVVLIAENRECRDQRIKMAEGEESPIVGRIIWSWRAWI